MTDVPKPRRKLPLEAFTDCWYVPGETSIIDLIHPDDGLTLHCSESEAQIRERFPQAQRMAFEEAWKLADAAGAARYKRDVSEVTEAQFTEALNVLPPVDWTTTNGVESFRISERLWGNLTDIYARLGDRYFKLTDDIRLPAATIAERVAAFAAANPIPREWPSETPRRDPDTDARLHGSSSAAPGPKPGDAS
jgi:hypothetical protein